MFHDNKLIKDILILKRDPFSLIRFFARKGYLRILPERLAIKILFFANMKRFPNLACPKTYNEKLQWLKINYKNPSYTQLVDKYSVKNYVKDKIGEEYVIPTLGVWDNFDSINFNFLPDRFVLKCTHDSGGIVICKDKSKLDIKQIRKKIEKALNTNFYYKTLEWPYKNVKPRIIAEKYMEDTITQELRDYKFFCFNGRVKAMFIATERQKQNSEVKFDFFDRNFNHLDLKHGHDNAEIIPNRPVQFNKMIELAEILSKGIPHVRVDFYEVDCKIYFGELTFFHHGGWTPFSPEKWDYVFGSWLVLPQVVEKIDTIN